jgi:hypothetical protein
VRNGPYTAYYKDGVKIWEYTDSISISQGPGYIGWREGEIYIDWIAVRKYTSPEPTISIGNEEINEPLSFKIFSFYSAELLTPGKYLDSAQALIKVKLNETHEYRVIYELPGFADFLIIKPLFSEDFVQFLAYKIGENDEPKFIDSCPTLAKSYLCSFNKKDFTLPLAVSLIQSSGTSTKGCTFSNFTQNKYLLALVGKNEFLIAFTQGTCEDIENKYYQIKRYGLPVSAIGEINITRPEKMIFKISYSNPRVEISNYERMPPGDYSICIKKIGEREGKALIKIESC